MIQETATFLDPDDIHVPDDLPPVPDDHVDRIARSIDEVGQLAPIVITPKRSLVTGRGRRAACSRMGRRVWAVFLDDASAAKVDLARADADLTVAFVPHLQIAIHTSAHDRWLTMSGRRAAPGRRGVTTADLAKRIGKSPTATSRYLRIGRNLADAVRVPLVHNPASRSWSVPTLLRLAALPPDVQLEVTRRAVDEPLIAALDAIAPIVKPPTPDDVALAALRRRLAGAEADAVALAGVPGMTPVVADLQALIVRLDAVIASLGSPAREPTPPSTAPTADAPDPAPPDAADAPAHPDDGGPAVIEAPSTETEPTAGDPEPPRAADRGADAGLARALADAIGAIATARDAGLAPPDERRTWSGPAAPFAVPLGRPLGLDVRVDGDRAEARGPTDALRRLDELMEAVPPDPPPSLRGALRRAVASRR